MEGVYWYRVECKIGGKYIGTFILKTDFPDYLRGDLIKRAYTGGAVILKILYRFADEKTARATLEMDGLVNHRCFPLILSEI